MKHLTRLVLPIRSIHRIVAAFSSKSIVPSSGGGSISRAGGSSSYSGNNSTPVTFGGSGAAPGSVSYNYGGGYGYSGNYYLALHKAAENNDIATINRELQAASSFNVDTTSSMSGEQRSALIYAAEAGHGDTVEVLVNKWGANTAITDENNWTALDHALNGSAKSTGDIKKNFDKIALFLVQQKAPANKFTLKANQLALPDCSPLIQAGRRQALAAISGIDPRRLPHNTASASLPGEADDFLQQMRNKKALTAQHSGKKVKPGIVGSPVRHFHSSQKRSMPTIFNDQEYYSKGELNEERKRLHRQGMEDAGGDSQEVAKKLAELLNGSDAGSSHGYTEQDIKAAWEEGILRADSYVGAVVRAANVDGYEQGVRDGQMENPNVTKIVKQAVKVAVELAVAEANAENAKNVKEAAKDEVEKSVKSALEQANTENAEKISRAKENWQEEHRNELAEARQDGEKEGAAKAAAQIKSFIHYTSRKTAQDVVKKAAPIRKAPRPSSAIAARRAELKNISPTQH